MLKHLAICHCLLAAALLLALEKRWQTVGILLLGVGYGGIGAAWGHWTEGPDWLSEAGAKWPPDRVTVRTAAIHAPALVAGLCLLRRGIHVSLAQTAGPLHLPHITGTVAV